MIINKDRSPKIAFILILGSFLFVHLASLLLPQSFETWNLRALDHLFVLRSNSIHLQPRYNDTIVHVDLNNTSIQILKEFYLNRSHHAKLINNLADMNVAIQLFDFIFAARTADKMDQELLEAVDSAGNVYFGMAFELIENNNGKVNSQHMHHDNEYLKTARLQFKTKGDLNDMYMAGKPLGTFKELALTSAGLGFLNLTPNYDGTFRRLPLIIKADDSFYPSIAFRVICDYLKIPPENIIVEPGKWITLKSVQYPTKSVSKDILIPIDHRGNMWVNFIGSWERMKHYNYVDVLHARDDQDEWELWQSELSGKIVVVSEVTTGSSDIGPVPTDPYFPLSGLHANAIHTILSDSFLREVSSKGILLIEIALMALIAIMAKYLWSSGFIIGTCGVISCYAVTWALSFLYFGYILLIVQPLLILIVAGILIVGNRYFNEEKEKSVLKKMFEAYFPPAIVKNILANPQSLSTKGQKKELSILFSDIKDFTKQTATMKPEQVQLLLNEYFELMTEIVFRYEGTLDKFIGDGLMVFFGDPEKQEDHALRCVQAAIDMQKAVREKFQIWKDKYQIALKIRIGVNTGTVVVGNMGSARRLSYTALGAAVNLTQRLEANAPVGGILTSKKTYDMIKKKIPSQFMGNIEVKGFSTKIPVYEVFSGEKNQKIVS